MKRRRFFVKRVILIHFEEEAKNYQAFSKIKKLVFQGQLKGEQMAVITHSDDGNHQFSIEDFIDFTGQNKSAKGSTIGMLIGILGGLPGMFLGWLTGSIIGSAQDVKEVANAKDVFQHMVSEIKDGQTGLVLIAEEEDNRPLNQLVMMELQGQITRLDYEDVEEDLKKAQQKNEA